MPELKIQTDPEQFLRSIENWEGTPSFNECLAGALLLAAISLQGDQFLRDIAGECKVSRSTFARWVTGASSPHPLGRKSVVHIVAKQLRARLASH